MKHFPGGKKSNRNNHQNTFKKFTFFRLKLLRNECKEV